MSEIDPDAVIAAHEEACDPWLEVCAFCGKQPLGDSYRDFPSRAVDPIQVIKRHPLAPHHCNGVWRPADEKHPCEPYRLAEALIAEQKAYRMCERALTVVERRLEWFEAQYRNQYARSADA